MKKTITTYSKELDDNVLVPVDSEGNKVLGVANLTPFGYDEVRKSYNVNIKHYPKVHNLWDGDNLSLSGNSFAQIMVPDDIGTLYSPTLRLCFVVEDNVDLEVTVTDYRNEKAENVNLGTRIIESFSATNNVRVEIPVYGRRMRIRVHNLSSTNTTIESFQLLGVD